MQTIAFLPVLMALAAVGASGNTIAPRQAVDSSVTALPASVVSDEPTTTVTRDVTATTTLITSSIYSNKTSPAVSTPSATNGTNFTTTGVQPPVSTGAAAALAPITAGTMAVVLAALFGALV